MRKPAPCRRTRLIAAALVATLLFSAAPALAQSCFTMQAELMHLLSRGAGGTGERARYESAYREQANVLAQTEMRARNAGCFGGGFFLFRREADASCNVLIPRLREMQDNLARLDGLRRRGGGDNSYRIRELQGMMGSRGCSAPGGDFLAAAPDDFMQPDMSNRSGTYRTLCVRSCDGYYFPISFATSEAQFGEDEQTCEAMCPGADVKLFYHDNPGGAPESMVSIDGEPYSSTPTAFRYRASYDSACTCRPAGGYATALDAPAGGLMSVPPDPTAPRPLARPAPGEDPETLADRAGGFSPRAAPAAVASGDPAATSASGQPIRIVGPPLGNAAQDELIIAPVPN